MQIGETAIDEARLLGQDVAALERQLAEAQSAAGEAAAEWDAAARELTEVREQTLADIAISHNQQAAAEQRAAKLKLDLEAAVEQGAALEAELACAAAASAESKQEADGLRARLQITLQRADETTGAHVQLEQAMSAAQQQRSEAAEVRARCCPEGHAAHGCLTGLNLDNLANASVSCMPL